MSKLRVALVSGAAVIAAWVPPATATPPGGNGQIAFTSERDGDPNVYVMNADGSGVVQLTDDPASDYDPTWSPDGSKILSARIELVGP